MANAIYPKYKEAMMNGLTNIDLVGGNVKAALYDTGTRAYTSTDQFYSDISAAVVGTPVAISATKSVTNGVFNTTTNTTTFTAVSGNSAEAIVLYIDTGTTTTSRLVCFLDTNVTNLPVTPNGGNITVTWNASGLFAL